MLAADFFLVLAWFTGVSLD